MTETSKQGTTEITLGAPPEEKAKAAAPDTAALKELLNPPGKTKSTKKRRKKGKKKPSTFEGSMVDQPLPRSSKLVWLTGLMFLAFFIWAATFELDEVTVGTGKIIPSSKEQVVQSREGGILVNLNVKEGDLVEAGQVLAQLDRTKTESAVEESASRMRAAAAEAARLSAEVNGTELVFPPEVREYPELVNSETKLYFSRRESLEKNLRGIDEALYLVRRELALTEPLVARGAASDVEVLRLKRQVNELERQASEIETQYIVKAREDLARANAEIEAQRSITRGRADSLTRLTLHSPVRGVVKDITVTTVGGVIPADGKLMEIVPVDEKLLVEARISPRDIAFIRPGLDATVKVTAYDYSIYGGLHGKVMMISPDTIQDEVKREIYYYRVYIRTDVDHLTNKRGDKFSIVPGMVTTADIHTGSKTILDYLIKPFNRGREAMRER